MLLGIAIFVCGFVLVASSNLNAQETADETDQEKQFKLARSSTVALNAGEYAEAAIALESLVQLSDEPLRYHLLLGDAYFMAGAMKKSVAAYDAALGLQADLKPQLWQRGLALYYAEGFKEGQQQFETHQTYNSNDVENAVWHAVCVAKVKDVVAAREKLIAIEGDRRVPMKEIYELFAGRGSVEKVMERAKQVRENSKGEPDKAELNHQLYYAHLYIGLYQEMIGEKEKSLASMKKASEVNPISKRQLMGSVADVHLKLRK